MTYKVLVLADSSGLYAGNALTFDSVGEACNHARGLWCRWTLVTDWAVVAATLEPDSGSYYTKQYAYDNSF